YTGNAHDPHLCYCWSKTAPTVGRVPAVMVAREACPVCGSTQYKKNGHSRHGKQNHQCRACARQFVAVANARHITDAQRTMVEHLLFERISLRGICRAVGVSLTWLLHFMVQRFAACPEDLHVRVHSALRMSSCASSKLRPMSCGVSCRRKPTSNGCGSPWTRPRARSLRFMWAIAVATVPKR